MEELENLRSMAEISIALTGFTGIVATFGNRMRGEWDDLELLRLKMLLGSSLLVLFLCETPLMIYSLHLTDMLVWQWSNIIQASLHLVGILFLIGAISKIGIKNLPKDEIVSSILLLPISIVLIGAQVAVAYGYFDSYAYFIFFAGLIYLLLLSAFHFVLLLIPSK